LGSSAGPITAPPQSEEDFRAGLRAGIIITLFMRGEKKKKNYI
jgi:hypothetical protein